VRYQEESRGQKGSGQKARQEEAGQEETCQKKVTGLSQRPGRPIQSKLEGERKTLRHLFRRFPRSPLFLSPPSPPFPFHLKKQKMRGAISTFSIIKYILTIYKKIHCNLPRFFKSLYQHLMLERKF